MDIKQSIYDIMQSEPEIKKYFHHLGLDSFLNPRLEAMSKKMTLERALTMKKISVEDFLKGYENFREAEEVEGKYSMAGLLPCPVKIPMADALHEFLEEYPYPVDLDLRGANLGLDFLKTVFEEGDFSDFPDVVTSAGMELFFNHKFQEEYMGEGRYISEISQSGNLKDLGADVADPTGQYGVIAVVPAVFIVYEDSWNGDYPQTWKELLDPSLQGKVGLPHMDLDLMNAMYITLYSQYGIDGIKRLHDNQKASLHPAEMTGRRNMRKPAPVSIAPYFFARMASRGKGLRMVWPKDGAIVSPIFSFHKDNPELKPLSEFLHGETVGKILSENGNFPSSNPKVETGLTPDQTLWWVGWDFLHSEDIEGILRRCDEIFKGDVS